MNTISVRDLQKNVKESVDESQNDPVVITRHGKPTAVLVGVEGKDWEDVVLQTDPSFGDSSGLVENKIRSLSRSLRQ